MKTLKQWPVETRVLCAMALGLIWANASATSQTLTTFNNGSDGALPYADLTWSGGTLYGTTREGGTVGLGTVFKRAH